MDRKTSASHPLRVDFIDGVPCDGRLGMTLAPGKRGPSLFGGVWERDLDEDLRALRDDAGTDVLVSLLEPHEFEELGVPDLLERAGRAGLRVVHVPIRDAGVPGSDASGAFADVVESLATDLERGATVVVHCRGGLGRSGLVAACTLTRFGFGAIDAMRKVREARPGAIETEAQEAYVRWFEGRREAPALPSRFRGALLGLAAGDALGTTVEFSPPGSFEPLTTIVGGGPFGLEPGQWTDDTSMALCLAESIVERQGFDAHDQMERYVRWWNDGHWSSTGRCFDIGVSTRAALERFLETGEPFSGSTDPQTAGNGSLMRLAPVALAFAGDPERAMDLAGESSRTTHAARTCIDACRYFAGLLVGALQGRPKDELLAPRFSPVDGSWDAHALAPQIDEVAAGSFRRREPPEIVGSGWVVRSLEAALYAFASTSTFEAGALRAVNLGNDADTTGAVYGQLAGAYYGADAIPERWRAVLAYREEIEVFAARLMAMAHLE